MPEDLWWQRMAEGGDDAVAEIERLQARVTELEAMVDHRDDLAEDAEREIGRLRAGLASVQLIDLHEKPEDCPNWHSECHCLEARVAELAWYDGLSARIAELDALLQLTSNGCHGCLLASEDDEGAWCIHPNVLKPMNRIYEWFYGPNDDGSTRPSQCPLGEGLILRPAKEGA